MTTLGHWFRFYDCALEDPKVQRLPAGLFKFWINVLCLASKHGGVLPPVDDVSFALRSTAQSTQDSLESLSAAGLLEETTEGLIPHNWQGRQFKSDVSTERVKRFRKRQGNVSETPPETAPEQRQIQSQKEERAMLRMDALASPLPVPIYTDSKHELWGEGVLILAALGVAEKSARSNIGRWLRDTQEDPHRVLGAIQRARDARVMDPIPWITRAIRSAKEFLNGKSNRPTSVLDANDEISSQLSDEGYQTDLLSLPKG